MVNTEKSDQKKIGRYSVLSKIGRGGMGEVYLVYDPVCERKVALKCIREDLREKKIIRQRFLREARIAAQLTHPSILPIYTIHSEQENLYYTMSYIEGDTFRSILKKSKERELKGKDPHPIGGSIPALCRIFLSVCEAAAYTHSRNILHRDLKPENIIVGTYGEVMILDWGIADYFDPTKTPQKVEKVSGTVAYMAPERAHGAPASPSTEVYSLGIILYQILTLELPFKRGNLQAFKKIMKEEELLDPVEVAPYREIQKELIHIVKKCLAFKPEDRYQNVDDLIIEIKNTIEGKPDWIFTSSLDIRKKDDWEFQENIMLAKHTAITRNIDVMEWVGLMVSEETFSGNIRLTADIKIHEDGSGIGFLFGIPEMARRKNIEEGFCLWLKVKPEPAVQLYRSSVMVIDEKHPGLKADAWYQIKIEKANGHVRFFLNDKMIFTYSSHLPLTGAHVGLLHKDMAFDLKDFQILTGAHNVMVNCLAVPDAFYAHKDYDTALTEYRHIGKSFPGRAEGRDAFFKAGITLLEKAKSDKNRAQLLTNALDEFEHLHGTPGAPLEYLGKSLVYRELNDHEEESKCLEYALRKFPKHPLIHILEEHIIYRMHESAEIDRESAYRIILLVARYFPLTLINSYTKSLIESLQKHWEPLSFIEETKDHFATNLSLTLSFWTAKTNALTEMIRTLLKQDPLDQVNLENALFCLLELGEFTEVRSIINELGTKNAGLNLLKCTLLTTDSALLKLEKLTPNKLSRKEIRVYVHILKKCVARGEYVKVTKVYEELLKREVDHKDAIYLDALFLWNFLLSKKLDHARVILKKYSKSELEDENSPLYSPYGAYLYHTKGPKSIKRHFSSLLERHFPPTTALLSHYLNGKINLEDGWIEKAFSWEKQELYLSLYLFYLAIGKKEGAKKFEKKLDVRFTRNHRKKIRS